MNAQLFGVNCERIGEGERLDPNCAIQKLNLLADFEVRSFVELYGALE
jgi:hypothetical protein